MIEFQRTIQEATKILEDFGTKKSENHSSSNEAECDFSEQQKLEIIDKKNKIEKRLRKFQNLQTTIVLDHSIDVSKFSHAISKLHDAICSTNIKIKELWNQTHSKQRFQLTVSDQKFLDIEEEQNQMTDLSGLDCTGFAFLKIQESRAVQWIKSACKEQPSCNDKNEFYSGKKVIKLLESWKYTQVSDLMEGDLVIYFDHFPHPKPTHTGLFIGNGQVLSKLGTYTSELTLHDIGDVPRSYGCHFLLFRKAR